MKLQQDTKNANRGTERGRQALAESLRRLGTGRSVLVDREGRLIAGNKTAEQAEALGLEVVVVPSDGRKLVVVQRTDLDLEHDAAARELAIADNRVAELDLAWDVDALRDQLADEALDVGAFFSEGEAAALLADASATAAAIVEAGAPMAPAPASAAPPPRAQLADPEPPALPNPDATTTQPGDLWLLGHHHRLLCGDSFTEDLARLIPGDVGRVDAVVTDPPYAIYGSSTGISSSIADDKMVRPFFENLGRVCVRTLKAFGHAYWCCDWRSYPSIWEAAKRVGLTPKNCLIWDKGGAGVGSSYANTYEMLAFLALLPEQKAMKSSEKRGQRQVHRPNIIRCDRVRGDERQHNAAKPVDLLAEVIRNSTDAGETVLDLFTGSGSTLLACEQLGRRFFGMEIEPGYCDVTVRRWEKLTGQHAVRVPAGGEA